METLSAEVREGRGKGPARQLRMSGLSPAVLYGPGGDPVALSVDPKGLEKALTTAHRRNALIELTVGSDKQLVMVKELQVHPVTRAVRHVDFYRVSTERPVEVEIPLRTKGKPLGVSRGGKLRAMYRTIPVSCTPDKIPSEIMVDVTELDLLETVAVSALPLPEGVTPTMPAERVCVMVEGESKRPDLEEDEEGGAEAAAPEADAEADK